MNFQDQTIESYRDWYTEAVREDKVTTLYAYLAGVSYGLREAKQVLLDGTDERSRPGQ